MRTPLLVLLLAGALDAQNPSQPKPAPAAKELAPDSVVATLNGRPITKAEMDRILIPLSPTNRMVVMRDPQAFLNEYAWWEVIAKMAEKAGLENKSPYRERIDQSRRQILVQAMADEATNGVRVMLEEQQKYYNENKDKYREVKGRLLFVPAGAQPGKEPEPGKKVLTDEEAKNKAQTLAAQARMGADFVKLVREHSEDASTKKRDGDLGVAVRSNTQQVPEPMRNAILTLKAVGQVAGPVRLENGYYLFQATEVRNVPFEEVRDEIYKELQNQQFQKWLEETRKQSSAKVEAPAYFQQGAK